VKKPSVQSRLALLGALLFLLSGCGATLINPGSPDSSQRYGIRKPVVQEQPGEGAESGPEPAPAWGGQ
jgi:hypothetical protein